MYLKANSGNYDLPVGTKMNLVLKMKGEEDELIGTAAIVKNSGIYTLEIDDETFSHITARKIPLATLYCTVGQRFTNGVLDFTKATIFNDKNLSLGGESIGDQIKK